MDRALTAARRLAVLHRLPAERAEVLHAGSNVVVHLAPAPVVVRVMTGTAALHADPAAWLERELAVCTGLAALGAAVVAPSAELPPGPHHVEGLWMTCWEHVAVDRAAPPPPPDELGSSLHDLHAALAEVRVELEPIDAVRDELRLMLDRAEDPRVEQWRAELATLSADVLAGDGPAQPVHGDASLSSLLTTTDGRRLWADFEDVRRGPVEADVAGIVDACRNRGLGDDHERALVAAYGEVEHGVLDAHLRLHALYGAAWRARPR